MAVFLKGHKRCAVFGAGLYVIRNVRRGTVRFSFCNLCDRNANVSLAMMQRWPSHWSFITNLDGFRWCSHPGSFRQFRTYQHYVTHVARYTSSSLFFLLLDLVPDVWHLFHRQRREREGAWKRMSKKKKKNKQHTKKTNPSAQGVHRATGVHKITNVMRGKLLWGDKDVTVGHKLSSCPFASSRIEYRWLFLFLNGWLQNKEKLMRPFKGGCCD